MGLFRKLAQIRPMMPFDYLAKIIGTGTRVLARTLEFADGLPVSITG